MFVFVMIDVWFVTKCWDKSFLHIFIFTKKRIIKSDV